MLREIFFDEIEIYAFYYSEHIFKRQSLVKAGIGTLKLGILSSKTFAFFFGILMLSYKPPHPCTKNIEI